MSRKNCVLNFEDCLNTQCYTSVAIALNWQRNSLLFALYNLVITIAYRAPENCKLLSVFVGIILISNAKTILYQKYPAMLLLLFYLPNTKLFEKYLVQVMLFSRLFI